MLVVSVSVAGLVTLAAMTQPALAPEAKHSLLQYVTGKYLLPSNCRVHFEWEEPQLVGETMTFTVKVSKTTARARARVFTFEKRVKPAATSGMKKEKEETRNRVERCNRESCKLMTVTVDKRIAGYDDLCSLAKAII